MAKKKATKQVQASEIVAVPTDAFRDQLTQFLDVMFGHHLDVGEEYRIDFYDDTCSGTLTMRVDLHD